MLPMPVCATDLFKAVNALEKFFLGSGHLLSDSPLPQVLPRTTVPSSPSMSASMQGQTAYLEISLQVLCVAISGCGWQVLRAGQGSRRCCRCSSATGRFNNRPLQCSQTSPLRVLPSSLVPPRVSHLSQRLIDVHFGKYRTRCGACFLSHCAC